MAVGSGVPRGDDLFTKRESRVLAYKACGLTNQQVADTMQVSRWTVEASIRSILKQSGATNIVHAVAIGFRDGYLAFDADGKLVI